MSGKPRLIMFSTLVLAHKHSARRVIRQDDDEGGEWK